MNDVASRPSASAVQVWFALGIVYVVWGSTYLAIKYAIATIPPFMSAGARFFTAGAAGLAVIRLVSGPAALRASRPQLLTAAVSGLLLLVGGNGLVVLGEKHMPSGLAALLVATVPLWMVVLRVAMRDRQSPRTIAGVLLGLVGVAVLLLPGGGHGGDLGHGVLLVLASLSWSAGSLLTTRRPVPANPFLLTAVQMVVAGLGCFALALARGEADGFSVADVSLRSWLALAYLAVFGSLVAFTAYVWVLGHAPVSVVSTYAYVNPAVAVLLGVLLDGEQLTGTEVAGGLVILLAVAVVVTMEARQKREARHAERPPVAVGCSTGGRRDAAGTG